MTFTTRNVPYHVRKENERTERKKKEWASSELDGSRHIWPAGTALSENEDGEGGLRGGLWR